MKTLSLVLALTVAAAGLHAQSAGALPTGRWPVGFTHLPAADTSRPLPSGRPRPLDIGVWYPARAAATPHLTYRSYFLLTPPLQDSLPADEAARRELDGFAGFLASHGASPAAVAAWLDAPMLATLDPPAAPGTFPLVLIAQGNGQSLHDQSPLCEYLASHGYVVATAPSPMRISGPLADEHAMGARASEQAQDLAFVLARAARRSDVDAGRVGLVGHSFGARAALLLGMREPRAAALVSLDGGIGTATGRSGLEHEPSFHPAALRAPVLHFYERLDPFMAPEFGLLRSLTMSDRWLVEVPAMHHHHFASLGAVSVTQPALAPALGATDETARAYLAVAGATLEFLDRFLGRRPGAPAWPGPGALPPPLGAPEHLARAAR
jgi:dienelactone hydrolase